MFLEQTPSEMNTKITLNAIKLNYFGRPCYTCGIFTWYLPRSLSFCIPPSICSLLKGNFKQSFYLFMHRAPPRPAGGGLCNHQEARSPALICIIELLSSKLMIIVRGETSTSTWFLKRHPIYMEIRVYTQPPAFYCHLSAMNDSTDRLFTIYASNYFYILISKSVRTDLTIITDAFKQSDFDVPQVHLNRCSFASWLREQYCGTRG